MPWGIILAYANKRAAQYKNIFFLNTVKLISLLMRASERNQNSFHRIYRNSTKKNLSRKLNTTLPLLLQWSRLVKIQSHTKLPSQFLQSNNKKCAPCNKVHVFCYRKAVISINENQHLTETYTNKKMHQINNNTFYQDSFLELLTWVVHQIVSGLTMTTQSVSRIQTSLSS